MMRAALAVSRPLFWLNTATPCVLAVILAERPPGLGALALVVWATWPLNLFVYALNDYCDHAEDARNPRKGSSEGARLRRATLRRLVALALAVELPFVVGFALTGSAASTAALLAVHAIAWAYSAPPLRLKSRPLLDSLANAGYVLPFVFALAWLEVPAPPWRATLAFALWTVGAHAFAAIADRDVDRAAGVRTIAATFGPAASARVAVAAYLAAAVVAWPAHPAVVPVLAAYAAVAAWAASPAVAHRAYRVFMGLNVAVGFAVTTRVALAHPPFTLWAAVVMLGLCLGTALAVRAARAVPEQAPEPA